MATVGEELAIAYARARAENPSLRKGQFMQRVFGGRYKNEQSAYQAYNQTVKGRRSGKRLEELNIKAQPPVQHPERIKGKRRPPPGGRLVGLWKVNITFKYLDENGKEVQDPEIRSFIAQSDMYTTLFDIPYIQEVIAASVDEYIDKWNTEYDLGNYTDVSVEVVPIYRHDSDNVVQIDDATAWIEEWPE